MFNIGGIQKTSLIDFPGLVSCVLFTSGCNFHCPYCHNPDLVTQRKPSLFQSLEQTLEFLRQRRTLLDGVVISGGEPTLQNGLERFCAEVKQIGYTVKLDTNGSRPQVLKRLLAGDLVDYMAMDIKTDPMEYFPLVCSQKGPQDILQSIDLLLNDARQYEFRTTCVRPFVSAARIEAICHRIQGAQLYVLQQFQNQRMLTPEFLDVYPEQCSEADLTAFKTIADEWVESCQIR